MEYIVYESLICKIIIIIYNENGCIMNDSYIYGYKYIEIVIFLWWVLSGLFSFLWEEIVLVVIILNSI